MSHFSLAVISRNPEEIEEMLAPYQETSEGPFAEFHDEHFELLDQYENGKAQYVLDENGQFILDDKYSFYELKKSGAEVFEISFKDYYSTFEAFVEEYLRNNYITHKGRYGYYANPDAKWDWWVIGGRWEGALKSKEGVYKNSLRIKDLDLSLDQEAYEEAIEFWEENIESEESTYPFKKYDMSRWANKEEYATVQATFNAYALLTEDGEWHAPGLVGYFGSSSATEESTAAFKTFLREYIEQTDPEYYITIVDCHI